MNEWVERFHRFLGEPDGASNPEAVREMGRQLGADLPEELVQVLAAYGDREYAEQVVLFGPRLLESENFDNPTELMRAVGESESRPRLPSVDGLLVWGESTASDIYALRHFGGRWAVSAYDGQNHQWIDFNDGFADWLYVALEANPGFEMFPIYTDETPYESVKIVS